MGLSCPHCGGLIEITKMEDVTSSKPVAQEKGDLALGVLKATGDSVAEKVRELDDKVAAMTGLAKLNNMANGAMGDVRDGLASGWGGAMLGAVKNREEELSRTGYTTDEFAKQDPSLVNKESAARMLQSMIHGSLSKGSNENS